MTKTITITFLIYLTLLWSKCVSALPGDPVAFGPLSSGCGEQVENPLDDNLRGMVGKFQCQGFAKEDVHSMCECMEASYGDEIKDSDDYKKFRSQLMDFDTFETAMVEFNQDVESIEMATLANFIAGQDPSLGDPFQSGGACAEKFSEHQQILNEGTGVKFDLSPIASWMDSHKREDYLMSQGVNPATLDKALGDFWRIGPSNGNYPIITGRGDEEGTNRIIQYIYSAAYQENGGPSVHQRISENLSSNANSQEFHPLSKKDALEILCNGLVSRFKEMMVENEAFKPVRKNSIIDRENTLTDRTLYSTDIEAFRGLRTRYLSSNQSDNSVLYFNQRFCDSLKKDETKNSFERPTDSEITSASDQRLKNIIEVRNDFFEMLGEEIEAGNVQYDEHFRFRDESEELLKEKLAEVGLEWSDFSAKMMNLSEDDDPIEAFIERLAFVRPEGIDSEKLNEILKFATQYHIDNQEMRKIATRFASLQEAYAVGQTKYDDALRELLHRKGTIAAVRDFLGKDIMLSRTAQYYASYDQDVSHDYIGPRPPVHAHMNISNNGLFVDVFQRIAEIEERDTNGATIVERLVAKAAEQGEVLADFRKTMRETVTGGFFTGRRTGSSSSSKRNRAGHPSRRSRQLNYVNSDTRDSSEVKIRNRQIINKESASRKLGQTRVLNDANKFGDSFGNRNNSNKLANTVQTQNLNPRRATQQRQERNEERKLGPNLGSSLEGLERRLNDLDRQAKEASSQEAIKNGEEVESEQDLALRAEIARLRGQIDSLRKASKEVDERSAKATLRQPDNGLNRPVTRNTRANQGSRTQRGVRSRVAASNSGSGSTPQEVATTSSSGVASSSGGSTFSSGSTDIPLRRQRGARSDNGPAEGDTSSTEVTSSSGVSLKLVQGSFGFAEVSANEANVNPVEIAIDFLSLPDSKKASFIEEFFNDRGESSAVLRQRDGRIVLIEKSPAKASRKVASENKGQDSEQTEALSNDNGVIYRVKTMNNALDDFLGNFEP